MESSFNISDLIVKSHKGELTATEQQTLTAWLEKNSLNRDLFEKLTNNHALVDRIDLYQKFNAEKSLTKIDKHLAEKKVVPFKPVRLLKYAATLLLPLLASAAIVYYFMLSNEDAISSIDEQVYFSDQYYFLVTSSLFDSKYQPKDGKWYNTRYNIQYVNNVVGGKEWNLGENKLLNLNAKVMWSGGKRQLPIDLEQSRLKGETVYFGNNPWSFKTKDYFRIDLGVKMHFFKKDKEHVLSLDIQNVTNRFNTWAQFYDSETDKIMDYPMAGLIPILNYRLEF